MGDLEFTLLPVLKEDLVFFDRLIISSFEVSSNLSQQKSSTAKIFTHIFSSVGLFCCDKFEETQNEESYFKDFIFSVILCKFPVNKIPYYKTS